MSDMTMRDQFAMAAVPAVIEVCRNDIRAHTGPDAYPDYVAQKAYQIADAMMKARQAQGECK